MNFIRNKINTFITLFQKIEATCLSLIWFADSGLRKTDLLRLPADIGKNKIMSKLLLELLKWALILIPIALIDKPFIWFVIIAPVVLIIMSRLMWKQLGRFCQQKRVVSTHQRLLYNNDLYDRKQRIIVNRTFLKLTFNLVIIGLYVTVLIIVLCQPLSIVKAKSLLIDSIGAYLFFYIGTRFFMYFCIKVNHVSVLMLLLLFTNPIIPLLVALFVIDFVKIQAGDVPLFNNSLDRVVYVFFDIGLQYELPVISIFASSLLQIIYAYNQPLYKLERSRLALELVIGIFALISISSIIYFKDIAEYVFTYMKSNLSFGKSFFEYANEVNQPQLNELEGFTTFFEQTFKLSLAPFSICSAIAMLVFKYREVIAKTAASSYYQQLAMNIEQFTLEQKLSILRKAMYYGGANTKNDISTHPQLRVITLHHLMDHSKHQGRYRIKLMSLKKRWDRSQKVSKSL
ncbi:hypothetical protein [Paenibacillus campi]|uniref:hypothetical protein n=1 Tax=Paenibacillus campi TaxID=3106031 RepID=UPI002AFE5F0B|nr:hypothetical protein [Paenibacillus sp. SGZ-1009]